MERSALEVLTTRANVPPYVAHKTFINFLNGMRQGIPSRIDRSIMKSFSGAVQGQLIATLGYFDLVDFEGTPTESLSLLVNAEGADRQRLLAKLVAQAYRFVFGSPLDLERATRKQIEEMFAAQHIGGETLRKALGLFLALAKDAGLKLSPHITRRPSKSSSSKRRLQTLGAKGPILDLNPCKNDLDASRSNLLLLKFPTFDPNWSDELKLRWFNSFERLINGENIERQ